jgi:hypothetical protein
MRGCPYRARPSPAVFDQNRSVVNRQVIKQASNFGNQYGHWDGFDVNFDYRAKQGLLLQGGFGAGKTMTDNCEIVDDVPEALNAPAALPAGIQPTMAQIPAVFAAGVSIPKQFCHQESPMLFGLKGLASYQLPYGIRIAGTWQSLSGPQVAANQIYANAGTAPPPGTSLTRPLTFAQNTVNVVVPGSLYGDRLNQIDLRFTKIVNVGPRPHGPELRHLQRVQFRHDPDAAEHVRHRVDASAHDPPAALREIGRAVGFLAEGTDGQGQGLRSKGLKQPPGTDHRTQDQPGFGATRRIRAYFLRSTGLTLLGEAWIPWFVPRRGG